MKLADLARGPKVDCHLTLYERELAVIDRLCAHYDCSRAAIVGAWVNEFQHLDLDGKVQPGRRPGGGRKSTKAGSKK